MVCKESRVGASLNELEDFGDEPSPLCSLPPTPLSAGLHSDWVLQKVDEIRNPVGISCEGFENQFKALLIAIKQDLF